MSKVAVIAGGSAGIGRACALALVAAGWNVTVFARRPERFDAVLAAGVHCAACDVGDAAAVQAAFEEVSARHPDGIDLLVNAAGVIRNGRLETLSPDDIAAVVRSNVLGTMFTSRAALPLLTQRRGVIVNLSSALANLPVPGSSVYVATKGAVDAFTRALAIDTGPAGVRVVSIQPGLVRSDIWASAGMDDQAYERMLADRARAYPLKRTGEPEEIAALVMYLASDAAGWITGAVIPIDGGSSVARLTA
ncbi:MAG TPA: SDR family oxidoreductase [Burkholderiaceae bacterium]|nr:SDR family oxidoreductase [Burkholderiaceae bacterium]